MMDLRPLKRQRYADPYVATHAGYPDYTVTYTTVQGQYAPAPAYAPPTQYGTATPPDYAAPMGYGPPTGYTSHSTGYAGYPPPGPIAHSGPPPAHGYSAYMGPIAHAASPTAHRVYTPPATTPEPPPAAATVTSWIDSLAPEKVKQILHTAAMRDPVISGTIQETIKAIQEQEAKRVRNFDHYSKEACHELNTRHDRLLGSKQYDVAFEVGSEISEMLNDMVDACKPHASYGTKFSALDTMRKIFKNLCLSHDVIAHEVRKSCYAWDDKFVKVFNSFTDVERARLIGDNGGEWVAKLEELVSHTEGHRVLEKVKQVLDELNGEDDGGQDAEKYAPNILLSLKG